MDHSFILQKEKKDRNICKIEEGFFFRKLAALSEKMIGLDFVDIS